jgi:catechol 2,3-dioxygenase
MDAHYTISGTADHGVSEAIYLQDPDDIGIELYCDRPRESWTVSNDGMVEMVTEPLDVAGLLAELD